MILLVLVLVIRIIIVDGASHKYGDVGKFNSLSELPLARHLVIVSKECAGSRYFTEGPGMAVLYAPKE
jgi:hypothetical protein